MASIKDVARRAGVSISTVSNVLNGTKYVSEDLKKRVNIAVSELEYEADPVARNMKSQRSKTIGVITADMCGLFYPYIMKGIYEVAIQKGYSVMIYDTNGVNEGPTSFERERQYFKALVANRVDGIIFCSMVTEGMEETYVKEIKRMTSQKKRIAMVSIERDFSKYGIDSVFSDSEEGGFKATDYLLGLGCHKVGHITGPIYAKVVKDRVLGYKRAIMKYGLPVDEEKMIANGDYTHQSGYLAMKQLLKSCPDMDGVFIANDQMAVGACMALKECGRKVPEDIKVIGYDNVFLSSVVEPPLSSIHVRKKHIGLEAARALIRQIEGEDEAVRETVGIEMETRLVVRRSTQSDAPSDWILSDW